MPPSINPELFHKKLVALTALFKQGQFLECRARCEAQAKQFPNEPDTANLLGATYAAPGQMDDANTSYTRALQINPVFARAYRILSTVRTYQDGDPQLRQMLQLLQQENLSKADRTNLNFAVAKAHEDTGNDDRAFSFLAEGNRLRKEVLCYDIPSSRALFARIKETFSKEIPVLRETEAPDPENHKRPVFVLGMPRSGTSLVEQILASHSQVHGAGELVLLGQSVNTVDWASRKLSSDQLRFVRESYLAGLGKLGRPEPYVVDKMPNNFWWIGFIFSALPDASIIHVKRDARATCWSNYRHYFSGRGNGYAYDLQDVTEYFKMYVDLMTFWHELFPGRIVDLAYESLTEDQEEETRKLLGQIGLGWESRCLEFHKTERAVQTASALQVRREMYQDSSCEWRKYEKYLEPMIEALRGF